MAVNNNFISLFSRFPKRCSLPEKSPIIGFLSSWIFRINAGVDKNASVGDRKTQRLKWEICCRVQLTQRTQQQSVSVRINKICEIQSYDKTDREEFSLSI